MCKYFRNINSGLAMQSKCHKIQKKLLNIFNFIYMIDRLEREFNLHHIIFYVVENATYFFRG